MSAQEARRRLSVFDVTTGGGDDDEEDDDAFVDDDGDDARADARRAVVEYAIPMG